MNKKVYVAKPPFPGPRAASMFNRTNFMGKNLLVKEATEKRGFRGRQQ